MNTVADLGGAVGGNCPSFMTKTQLGAPFLARRAPPFLTQMHSFFEFCSEFGEAYKLRRYQIEEPDNFK